MIRASPAFRLACLSGLVALQLALGGCQTAAVNKAVLQVPLPQAFHHGPDDPRLSIDNAARAVDDQWWRGLGSRELDHLVDRALANNPDLRISTLQIVQAKVRSEQTHAAGMPTVLAPLRSAVQAPGGVVGTVPAAGTSGTMQKSFQGSLQGNWRLDVWGEQSALNESSDLQLARAVHAREDVQRNLIAGLVSSYVSYAALNDAVKMAHDNEAVARDLLQAVERRVAALDATLGELEQQRSALYLQQAAIPGLEQQREDVKTTMAQLLGTVPGALTLSDVSLDSLQFAPIGPGLPSSLLLRRPDIRMVEARMLSANADINVARARLLPPVDLSAQMGSSALSLAQLLQPQSLFWNTIASLAVTVFDGGKRAGDKAYAQAYYEEMVETYGRTVYQAVREVESALSSYQSIRLRLDAQQRATRSALAIFKISNDAYALGSIDLSALLESRRNYQRHVDDTQRVKAELLRSQVNLSQALGLGGTLDSEAVGTGDRVLYFTDAAPPHPAGDEWSVELPSLFHRTAVLPAWRDLRSRTADILSGKALKAVYVGQVNDGPYRNDAWYRLSVTGFDSEQDARKFCGGLRTVQQNCQIARVSARPSQQVSWSRQNGN